MIYSTIHTREMDIVSVDTLNDDMMMVAQGVKEVTGEPVTHVLKLSQTGTIIAYCGSYAHAEAYRQGLEGLNHSFDADTTLEALPQVPLSFWRKAKKFLTGKY